MNLLVYPQVRCRRTVCVCVHAAQCCSWDGLVRRMSQLRRDMGRLLGMRHTPRLEFRVDRLSQEQKAVEDALDKLRTDR